MDSVVYKRLRVAWVVPRTPGYGPDSFKRDHNNTALFSMRPSLSSHCIKKGTEVQRNWQGQAGTPVRNNNNTKGPASTSGSVLSCHMALLQAQVSLD